MPPASGVFSPTSMLVNTVLPDPLRPKTTMVSPGWISRSTPVSTLFSPKDLWIPRKEIRGPPAAGSTRADSSSALRPEENGEFGEKDIGNQNHEDGPHHRSLGGLAHPERAMFGVKAVVAAHGAHDEPKDGSLADARQDILQRQIFEGQGVVISGASYPPGLHR